MPSRSGSVVPAFIVALLAIAFAVVRGVEWLGQPLRLVHLVTLVGLSMTAGVLWCHAVLGLKEPRPERNDSQ